MKKTLLALGMLGTLVGCSKTTSNTTALNLKESNYITDTSNGCSTDNCQRYRKEFDYVVYVGKKIYCYWDLKKTTSKNDFDQIAKDIKASINDNTTNYDFYMLMRKWAGSFQDGHVNAMWGDDMTTLEEMVVPVRLELLAPGTDHETLIVARIGSNMRGLPVGAVVTKINGTDAMERLNNIEKFMSGSTSRMRRAQAARLIFSFMNSRKEAKSAVKIEYTYNSNTNVVDAPRNVTLPVNQKASTQDAGRDYNDIVQVRVLPNNIGYLRIDSFEGGKEMMGLLERSLSLLDGTSALLIDLRQNGGGDQSGNAIIAHLIKEKVVRYHQRLRISDLLLQDREDFFTVDFNEGDEFTPWTSRSVAPAAPQYTGKVYVLTSSNCFSACDTFTSAMKENKLATIVGEGTGGGTGTPFVFDLGYSGLKFRYSVAQGLTAVNKTYLEGQGTLPDITISPTVEERMSGEDQQLLKTINRIASDVGQTSIEKSEIASLPNAFTQTYSDSYSLKDENNELKKLNELETKN